MKWKAKMEMGQIARIIDNADRFARRNGLHSRYRHLFLLSLEEILLIYRDHFGENKEFTLSINRKNGNLRAALTLPGASLDPFAQDSPILQRMQEGLEGLADWSWRDGANRVDYSFQIYSSMFRTILFSWKYMRGQRVSFVIAVTAQLVSVALSIFAPILGARIIVAFTEGGFHQILYTALMIFAVRVISNIVLFLANHYYNVVYNRTLTNLETDLVDAVLRITSQCMDEQGTGLFIERLTVDTTRLATGFNTMADMSAQMFNYIGILAALLILSPPVFAVVLALLGIQSWLEVMRARRITVDDRIYREANERFTGFVSEMVRGAADVKLLNSESTFKKELETRIHDANEKRLHMQNRSWAYSLTRMELGTVGYLGFMVLLALLIERGLLLPVNAIVLFNYYSELGITAITLFGQFMEFIRDYNLSAERIQSLLSDRQFPKEHFGRTRPDRIRGEVRFDKVRFAYNHMNPKSPPRMILRDMSFVIPAGATAAIVGRSGCGKSTAIRLISRLYDAGGGTVTIDGTDVRLLDRETLRANIAVVSQQPYIFNLSIRENLRLVKPDLTREEMEDVCRKACIAEDIESMPDKYDTLIGEGGTNLSGGQRQRLALARTLLRDYRILLLDEATSALDNVTQVRIRQALDNIRGDRTVIMVAHRLSTIIGADIIFYFEDGKVLDQGNHAELLARCPQYRELYRMETGEDG